MGCSLGEQSSQCGQEGGSSWQPTYAGLPTVPRAAARELRHVMWEPSHRVTTAVLVWDAVTAQDPKGLFSV